jgi:hypothetical protein
MALILLVGKFNRSRSYQALPSRVSCASGISSVQQRYIDVRLRVLKRRCGGEQEGELDADFTLFLPPSLSANPLHPLRLIEALEAHPQKLGAVWNSHSRGPGEHLRDVMFVAGWLGPQV